MKIVETEMAGLLIIETQVFEDKRGFFFESYRYTRMEAFGIPHRFVQDNLSYSVKGTLRGLHFQVSLGLHIFSLPHHKQRIPNLSSALVHF